MRQAGRYLSEYRILREEAGNFLNLCYNPKLAAKVTLQPIERFGFDAAILFSDILVVPHALGQEVKFVDGNGPRLRAIRSKQDLNKLFDRIKLDRLSPVYETVSLVAGNLSKDVALIGFAGNTSVASIFTHILSWNDTPYTDSIAVNTFLQLSSISSACPQLSFTDGSSPNGHHINHAVPFQWSRKSLFLWLTSYHTLK